MRLYLTQREYDALLDAQAARCRANGCNATQARCKHPNFGSSAVPTNRSLLAGVKSATRPD